MELWSDPLCTSLWNSSIWWWEYSQPVQKDQGEKELTLTTSTMQLFFGIWSPSPWLRVSGRYLHSSESFICFGQGFDPKNACCRAYEENHNSWNSRASMVPVSPSSLFGGASTRHGTASQNGISSCIWVVMPLLYDCIQLFLIVSTSMQEKVFRLFISEYH